VIADDHLGVDLVGSTGELLAEGGVVFDVDEVGAGLERLPQASASLVLVEAGQAAVLGSSAGGQHGPVDGGDRGGDGVGIEGVEADLDDVGSAGGRVVVGEPGGDDERQA
jgi:hypothetical protein